jgi:hypothetical protein
VSLPKKGIDSKDRPLATRGVSQKAGWVRWVLPGAVAVQDRSKPLERLRYTL